MTEAGFSPELIAVDLDGTLLDSHQQVSRRNRDALHRAHNAGLKVVLCTGRSYTETRDTLAQIGLELDATVTVGGALLSEAVSGRTLQRSVIPAALATEAITWLTRRGYSVLWLHDAQQADFDGYVIDGPRRHPAINRWMQTSGCRIRESEGVPEMSVLPLRLTILDDLPELEMLADSFRKSFAGRLSYNLIELLGFGFTLFEIFAGGVDKWYGIRQLCDRWGIDPARTVAIGDDLNDLPMLKHAGLGIAMENARSAVREVADITTASNDASGVADAIERLLDG